MGRITYWNRKNLWIERETGQVYTRLKNISTTEKQLKQRSGEKKKLKKIGYITNTMGHYPK